MDIDDPWRSVGSSTLNHGVAGLNILNGSTDDQLDKLKQSLRNSIDDSKWGHVYKLLEDIDSSEMEFQSAVESLNVNDKRLTGVPVITYCIAYDRLPFLETLLSNRESYKKGLDLNLTDDLNHWTPIMWCCYLNRYACLTELMRFSDKLDMFYTTSTGQSVQSLLVPGTAIYSFMDIHQVFNGKPKDLPDLYKAPPEMNTAIDPTIDELNLRTVDMRLHDDIDDNTAYFEPESRSAILDVKPDIPPDSEFNYKHLEPRQYISFTSLDIESLSSLVAKLPNKYPHKPNIAAAVTFQCIRYAHHKRHNRTMIESIHNSCLQKLLAADPNQDILKQSYTLGYLNLLYYYMYRDEMVFPAYPHLLQDIIDSILLLIKNLSASINSRLEPLLHPGILEYTTISDVKETLYKNDWNFFKKRKLKRMKHDSYDDILQLLYPPSVKEQMKPSPLKIVQIFGALTYVFDLHDIHPVLLQQCLSISSKWLANTIFNEIIQSKQLSSRAHAMQIRLNLSILQDWVKNHNFSVQKPDLMDDFMWQRFPLTIVQDVGSIDLKKPSQPLENVYFYKPIKKEPCTDESNSLFFYQSFAHIWQFHLEPVYQLLQWLQVATSLDPNEDVLNGTIDRLSRLNVTQLYKSLDRYRYELNEGKTSMKKLLKQKVKAIKDQQPVLLDIEFSVKLTLPTLQELYFLYDECESSYRFLPILPIAIQDEIDEIHDQIKIDNQFEVSSNAFEDMDEPKPAAHAVWTSNEMKLTENPW
ncbi:uncharacterized protein KLLA0_C15851g [Kluyveromyces lactis]|uniref:KLLA0C15851p n=1 Tax=Kluyveromyces lactis (strain ATCC 8585 / CBS 2359 / DSM 70799 / NBRC 1267 / NRRL Y-1140 / WM37) TaxID=284590 RepID=Q6CT31_KLULA|nr:uncharacterized protein KLLA0_C15851g [Kluyveromyces lactis]CAH01759.1 KLLA0C15851p [Kluyveromyces lactis]|eukprot:XP_452908.1 uncharacterized protein KLLA0_C15851g [Kluyveromyces lactis]